MAPAASKRKSGAGDGPGDGAGPGESAGSGESAKSGDGAKARDDAVPDLGDDIGPGDHLYLIDASGYIYRAYHALPPLTRRSDGLPVGAVAGFCGMLWKFLSGFAGNGPTHLAAVFDYSDVTFRNEIYPEYKAQRPPAPEDLVPQFPLIREAAEAFGVPAIEIEGYEADDIIATYARAAARRGARVTIVSSDKDLMQLVSERIRLLDPIKDVPIGPDEVEKRFGVPPDKVVEVQALAGDPTDNIPGAPGIGIKTAAELIRQYGTVENLLAHAEEIPQPKRRQTLIEHAEAIRLSRRLVELCDRVPGLPPFSALRVRPPDPEKLLGFLARMEFRTLANRVAAALGVEPPPVGVAAPKKPRRRPEGAPGAVPEMPPIDRDAYVAIRGRGELEEWLAAIREQGWFCIDLETTSLDEMRAEVVGVALATGPGRAGYVPVAHVEGDGDLLGARGRVDDQLAADDVLSALGPVLADPSILKIGQNLKYDLKVLARHGLQAGPIDDTMLISYALEAGLGGHGMDELAERHLGHRPISIKKLIGTGKAQRRFDAVAIEEATTYAAEDADVTIRLWWKLRPRLAAERLSTVYHTLERPLVPVLVDMELAGMKIDPERLAELSKRFAQKMAELEDEIHRLAGRRFNVGSPKQLGEILFDEMGLPGGRRGKAGAWSTDAAVLEELAAQGHELPAKVLEWRQLSKLKSTYTDALPKFINPETGRVHTSFSLAATSTGRLASTDPNLQNIPVRTEEGREIRAAFIAEEGNVIVSLDYSQIELRIFAHMADIDAMKEAFHKGLDIHAMTASEVFGVPIEGMDPMIRRKAKAINFGVIYGISAYGLAAQLGISREEAQAFIDAYFERFPGIRDYMERTKEFAREKGYVETLFGRRIHTPDVLAKGPRRGVAERAAINAPIQGTAADIIRRAMIRVPEALERGGLSGRMILQIHDELLFEVPEAEAEATIAAIRPVMEGAPLPAVKLDVPLVVDAGVGRNWAEAH